ncbi:MAG: bifunctional proline dehydrogenase/L-glutamate gamma-semialdehyde dehydrogenase, partial [Desulfobacterales bacterium]
MHISDKLIEASVTLAESWQDRANVLISLDERKFQSQMQRLLTHPIDKVVLARMIDQSFRSRKHSRVADQMISLFGSAGIPAFFTTLERGLIRLFLATGKLFSAISIPVMIFLIRRESRAVILPGEAKRLLPHLAKRKKHHVRMNINHLGEAVLGEQEAARRLETYIEDLENPDVECISVKISTLTSQINTLAFDHTLSILKERLVALYRAAQNNMYLVEDKERIHKFVNLDMEEYRDMRVTFELFTGVLDRDEFTGLSAGIVLQSYLPDSFNVQQELTQWARKRCAAGGAPIRLRIVKGANLEMERVESAIRSWPLATYDNKIDVDANYRRMVEYGMRPENIAAVNLGIASHNLFELAFAYCLAEERNVTPLFTFEMLEGMADHIRRAIQETCDNMLLYAPVATKAQFINAIAYLIRRLDENTARDNFLRYASNLSTDSPEWVFLKKQFLSAFSRINSVGTSANRTQNRRDETFDARFSTFHSGVFINEPDTDWSLAHNQQWADEIVSEWKKGPDDIPIQIPLVVSGSDIPTERQTLECMDPSSIFLSQANKKKGGGVCVAVSRLASPEDIGNAVHAARADPDGWRDKSLDQRHEILARVALNLRKARGDLIGSAVANTGKTFSEADVEVSEAVDFAEYYPYALQKFAALGSIHIKGKGVGAVISPWNFPVAIPCGGITAALAAGNTVIFKPASAAIVPAFVLCRCFWEAGISKNTLQFIPCRGSESAEALTHHPDVDFIVFTGGTDTGLGIIKDRPDIYFAGETGGKNATIVTSMADRDQAIKNVIHSAFSNGGQKCSATSLLILEKELYNDSKFKTQLVDAAKSWRTGSAWDFENNMGPLTLTPEKKLKKALTKLGSGESWALKPENLDGNPHLWTPGIKWGTKPGSPGHMTEFFGPVLSVLRADTLDQAISLANQTGYGLTSGIESLDIREQAHWEKKIKAGNLYINRGTTGAVVLRQPFGGMGKSAIGSGRKAGGPNYAMQFMDIENADFPESQALQNNHSLLQIISKWRQNDFWGKTDSFHDDFN